MNIKNISILFLSIMFSMFTPSTIAVEGLSANAAVTNSYLWRGLEQTDGKAAVSGGIDYADKSGFYLGTWVSDADWAPGMTYELDIYGGFTGDLSDTIAFDVGFVHYAYPDADDNVDFTEVNAAITFGAFSVGYALLVDADAAGVDTGDDSYISADAEFDVAGLGLALHIGTGTDDFYAGESFVEYGASLSKDGFTFGLSNTDLDDDDMKVYVSYGIDIDL